MSGLKESSSRLMRGVGKENDILDIILLTGYFSSYSHSLQNYLQLYAEERKQNRRSVLSENIVLIALKFSQPR